MDTTTYQEQLKAQRAEREALWRLEWEWAEAHVAARQRRALAERRARLRVVAGRSE